MQLLSGGAGSNLRLLPAPPDSNSAFKKYAKTPDFHAKYDLISSILTCIQKVCKKSPDFHAKYDLT